MWFFPKPVCPKILEIGPPLKTRGIPFFPCEKFTQELFPKIFPFKRGFLGKPGNFLEFSPRKKKGNENAPKWILGRNGGFHAPGLPPENKGKYLVCPSHFLPHLCGKNFTLYQ